eukprot:81133-Amphidinium_carterae.1
MDQAEAMSEFDTRAMGRTKSESMPCASAQGQQTSQAVNQSMLLVKRFVNQTCKWKSLTFHSMVLGLIVHCDTETLQIFASFKLLHTLRLGNATIHT